MGFGPNDLDAAMRYARDTGQSVHAVMRQELAPAPKPPPLPPESAGLTPLPDDAGISTSVSMAGLEPDDPEEEAELRKEFMAAGGKPTKHVVVQPRQAQAVPAPAPIPQATAPDSFIDLESGAAVLDGYPIALSKMELAVIKRVVSTSVVRSLRQEASMIQRLHGRKRIQTAPQKKATRKRRARRVPKVHDSPVTA